MARSLFAEPQPFEDEGRGGVIVASVKGKVEVLVAKNNRYADPKPRAGSWANPLLRERPLPQVAEHPWICF